MNSIPPRHDNKRLAVPRDVTCSTMDQHHNPPEKLHHTSEDKLSKPGLRGQLLHPDNLHAGSLQADSSPSRFGSMRLGIQESVVGVLIYFPLLALLRWVFGRRGHSVPAPVGDKANKSAGDSDVAKYAAITIRQDLRTATGSRAKRREEAMVSGSSSDPGVGHDVEAGASAPSSPRPRPPLPPLSIDEVLQKSVWGFREKWWPMSSTAAFEAARIEEAEGNVGDIGGFDTHPEAKAFLDEYVYSHPLCISIGISRTCPAVEENICYLPSPSAADAVYPLPSSTSTSPPSISSTCPAVNEHTCLVPSPSVVNAVGASFSSAAEEVTECARSDTTETDVAGSILAGSRLPPAVVSSTPVVMGPMLVETLSIGEEGPEIVFSRVESSLTLSHGFAGKETISLDLPDGDTGGELETSESGYDGDDDNDDKDDDDDDDDFRPGTLIIGGVMLDSREQQQGEETEEMEEEEQEDDDITTMRLADGAIGGKLRAIGSDDDNDDNDVRILGSNRFAVLFESSDEEDEQEDGMEIIRIADKTMEEKLTTIGSDDENDGNDATDAPHVSNNRFAVLFESSEGEEEEEEAKRLEEEEEEWGEKWGEEWDEEEEEEDVEEKEPKEEMEARQMKLEDGEAQEMQENWREMDEEWEALEECVEDEEEEEEEGVEESVDK